MGLAGIVARMHAAETAAGRAAGSVRLIAVSKVQPNERVEAVLEAGHRLFGENYVQEALGKMRELVGIGIEWHLIGHLQSNKAREVAEHFDWVQSVDRPKLVEALARHRPASMPPLNLLVQVNVDDEASKHGCRPEEVAGLAEAIAAEPRLRLRGLMAIPAPHPDTARRIDAFRRMQALQDQLAAKHPGVDTLSMGMSEDYALAVAHGATMVRIGTALFGARPARTA